MKLKPCPFCGSKGVYTCLDDIFNTWDCGCDKCSVVTKGYKKEIQSIRVWNRRVKE